MTLWVFPAFLCKPHQVQHFLSIVTVDGVLAVNRESKAHAVTVTISNTGDGANIDAMQFYNNKFKKE